MDLVIEDDSRVDTIYFLMAEENVRKEIKIPWISFGSAEASPTPLTRVHAHNDYEHKRPLFDALDHGFCSIEADIYLVDGQLLVAHMRSQVKPERTLEKLYLDPLREQVKQNGGRGYAAGAEGTLLVG